MKHAARRSTREGFTLIEILVSLVLLSVLVAAVFPVVTQQVGAADPTRVASDLASIRTGIETFNLNVKGRYPGDLDDLANPVAATGDADILGAAYGSKDVGRWKGPYFDASIATTGGSLQTGYEATIPSALVRFNATKNAVWATGDAATDQTFVAVEIQNLSGAEFTKVNETVDGVNEGANAASLGKLRQTSSDSKIYYLAAPIAK